MIILTKYEKEYFTSFAVEMCCGGMSSRAPGTEKVLCVTDLQKLLVLKWELHGIYLDLEEKLCLSK